MPRAPILGVLSPLIGGFYYASILSGIQRAARRRGARVVAFQTTSLDLLWPDEPDTLPIAWNRIDGFIGINTLEGQSYYERLLDEGRPLVLVSARMPQRQATSILPENHGGTLAAVRHLIAHGHRRIAFAGMLSQLDIAERYDGYRAALREAGIEPDPSLFFPMQTTLELEGHEIARRLVEQGLPCTALVAGTDLNAIGILRELSARGYRIPEDLAIVGFDDVEPARYMDPPLATVRQGFDVLAAKAADVLLDHVLDGAPLPGTLRVPTVFVPRHSCGCARRSVPLVRVDAAASEGGAVERLEQMLLQFLADRAAPGASISENTWPSAERLARHLFAIGKGEPGLDLRDLAPVWSELFAVAHDAESVETLMSLLEHVAGSWQREQGADAEVEERLRLELRELRFEMLRAWRVVEQGRLRYYDSMTEANRAINLALIGAELKSAQDLSWLGWTSITHGWLGTWSPKSATSARQLRVVSVYTRDGEAEVQAGACIEPPDFPNAAMCRALGPPGSQNILTVIPLTGRENNRGLLAVVGPVEVDRFDDMGTLGQWAALLSAAMDRQELLSSLREGFEREHRIAETLRESEERYALAAQGANDGLWDWNIVSGKLYCSPRWKAIAGLEGRPLRGDIDDWFARVHPEDLPALKAALDAHFSGARAHIEHEYRMLHAGGAHCWVLCRGVAVFDKGGRPIRAAGSQTDITTRKRGEEELRRNALHDALTGLPNRALLIDRLEQAIERSRRDGASGFAVLFLDLDGFKTINDSLGHLAGDELLIRTAERLRHCLRATDTVARLGGDEFAVVLSDVAGAAPAVEMAERLQASLRAPLELDGHRVVVTTSIGITLSSPRYQRADDYLRDADTAMYRAKHQGRGRHALFDARMHEQAMERLSMEGGLRRALERGELLLRYQPIVSASTGLIVGAEALLRWEHPERGCLLPNAFLPLAEETGLISPIGDWVLAQACKDGKRWQQLGYSVRISVNVSPQQLKQPSFPENVARVLSEAGLDAPALGIELVESSLIDGLESTVQGLGRLAAMGIQIAVDDFGTGYSSLSYLKRLPIHSLKIDRSFTQGVPQDPNDTAISTAIIAMAASLNLDVTAEGVETRDQATFLRAHGCTALQGHWLSPPLAADDCLELLQRWQISELGPTGTDGPASGGPRH